MCHSDFLVQTSASVLDRVIVVMAIPCIICMRGSIYVIKHNEPVDFSLGCDCFIIIIINGIWRMLILMKPIKDWLFKNVSDDFSRMPIKIANVLT